jgi:hypothetical protein
MILSGWFGIEVAAIYHSSSIHTHWQNADTHTHLLSVMFRWMWLSFVYVYGNDIDRGSFVPAPSAPASLYTPRRDPNAN